MLEIHLSGPEPSQCAVLEGIDGELHPAVDGQSLDKDKDVQCRHTKLSECQVEKVMRNK